MSDTAQQIKEKLDLADFLRGYLQLTPAGKNLKANCPFHKEKTPSFMISPDRQIWHCFGCGAGGDIIGFLMRYENLEFFEALKILGEKAGIDVGRAGTQDQKKINILYEINRAAKDFFKKSLNPQSLDYLKSRGLKRETIEEFEIGFAPDSPDALTRALLSARYNVADVERAGLVFKTQRGTYCDRFRNRIMFPLYNKFGKIVGFTGRIVPWANAENVGKYVNSPETPIFNKSKLLYGLDKSKNFIRENRTAVLMEGQMDFIMSWQDGIKNLVATSGTALTIEHLKNLKRIADALVLSFDQDEAGQMATERTIDLAAAADLSVKISRLPSETQAKDPADIALSHPGLLKKIFLEAQPAMEYYLDKYPISNSQLPNLGIVEIKKNIRAILAKIKNFESAVERAYWIKEVAKLSGFREENLLEEMEGIKNSAQPAEKSEVETSSNQPPLSRKEIISQRIASLVLNNRDLHIEVQPQYSILPSDYQAVLAYHFNQSLSLAPGLQSLADLVNLRSGLETGLEKEKARLELLELFRQLRLENYKEKRQAILTAIRDAESRNDERALSETLVEFDRLSKEIQNLEQC